MKEIKIIVSEQVEKTKCYFIESARAVICHDSEDVDLLIGGLKAKCWNNDYE